ncbi:MAG: helicase [Bacteroidetes bacterium]|jgi:ATP-independent RNA helicase DbpA|nr:helicase [Bacteroidota bacterium]
MTTMIQQVLKNLKISELNAMQKATIEASAKANDLILLSPTGSGKTLGFLLPVLLNLKEDKKGVQTLILVPSRELAIQIETVFKQMSTGFKINCCYGGHSTRIEKNNLEHPPAVLVGTPGRIAYHVRNTNFDVTTVNMLVLDEFDKSLEFGFKEDMSFIIYELKNLNKRMLTSATNMEEIPAFTGVKKPVKINFLSNTPTKSVDLKLKMVSGKDKLDVLFELICKYGNKSTLVFCNHRDAVERISQLLKDKGLAHDIFHGGMEQDDRERALIKFRNGSHRILITTDLASRGLDIPEIELVMHYQLPTTEDSFIHRNGRTARMNAKGTAYLILSDTDHFPTFIKDTPEKEDLNGTYSLPENTEWSTLYIAAGKKDKINKMDIVGMLLQKGKLAKEELGLIEVLDKSAYAAVKRNKIHKVVQLVKEEKIKGRKIKMAVSE